MSSEQKISDDSEQGQALQDRFALYSQEFQAMRLQRHLDGQKKYGALTFLEKDMFQMTFEELADAMNYLEYQYVKFRLLQEAVHEKLDEALGVERRIYIGKDSFDGGTSGTGSDQSS